MSGEQRDYGQLVNLAAELEMYRGYLDSRQQKEEAKVRARFNGVRNRFVYNLLREGRPAEELAAEVGAEIDELVALTPDWATTLDFVRHEILRRLEEEAGRAPWVRHAVRWAPLAAGVAALIVYGTVRVGSGITVDAPLASHAGLVQRAEALHKMVRYEDLMSGRRNGLVKSVMLWPIEPTEAEIAAGQEFAGLTVEGARYLVSQGRSCTGLVAAGDTLTDSEVAFIDSVAERMAGEPAHQSGEDLDHLLKVIDARCRTA